MVSKSTLAFLIIILIGASAIAWAMQSRKAETREAINYIQSQNLTIISGEMYVSTGLGGSDQVFVKFDYVEDFVASAKSHGIVTVYYTAYFAYYHDGVIYSFVP